jgi:hypothetical protein
MRSLISSSAAAASMRLGGGINCPAVNKRVQGILLDLVIFLMLFLQSFICILYTRFLDYGWSGSHF